MSLNLDTLKSEIRTYLDDNGFVTFQGFSRRLDEMREVEWDVIRYPDYRPFLEVARHLGVKLVVFHHRDDVVDGLGGADGAGDGKNQGRERQPEEQLHEVLRIGTAKPLG